MKQSIIISYSIPKSCKIIRRNQQFKVHTSKVGSTFKIQMSNFQSSNFKVGHNVYKIGHKKHEIQSTMILSSNLLSFPLPMRNLQKKILVF